MAVKDKEQTARDTEIERSGTKIILPERPMMSYDTAIETLQRKKREEEQEVQISEMIEVYPQDGAIAANKAMREVFGWAEMVPSAGFFGGSPPTMMGIRTGPGPTDTTSIAWGRFSLPGVEGWIEFGIGVARGRQCFRITGIVKQKHYHLIVALAKRTREIAAQESIYRHKALIVNFAEKNWLEQIHFIDVSKVKADELILPEHVQAQVETSIFAPILYSKQCKEFGVPVKRGVLLEGPYGTGKTMIAYIAAKMAVAVGRTFIYAKSEQLAQAFDFAQQYAPAVLFCEDIDRITSGARDEELDKLANTIDGLTAKESELILVLTTNDVTSIHPVMLRPGRLDAVITVSPPDANAAARLVQLYGRGLLAIEDPAEMLRVGESLEGQIPAMIRECVERAKLAAIFRQNGVGAPKLTASDIEVASMSLQNQQRLLNRKDEPAVPTIERAVKGVVENVFEESRILDKLKDLVEEIHNATT